MIDDEEINAMLLSLHKDEYGGEWKKNLSPDHELYDPNAPFDQEAEDEKHEAHSAWSGFFADGSKERIYWEWAEFCQECPYCVTSPSMHDRRYCRHLNKIFTLDWLRLCIKDENCPMGFDKEKYIKQREHAIAKQEIQCYVDSTFKRMMQIYQDCGTNAVRDLIKEVQRKVRYEENKKTKRNHCQT